MGKLSSASAVPAAARVTIADLQLHTSSPVSGLYLHIPFCFHKCHYCDFYSITRQSPDRMKRFVELMLQEARMWSDGSIKIRPKYIFFGGGTPSLLPLREMDYLLTELPKVFDFSDVSEWTIECNPATVDLPYLQMLRSHGVDRLSFGAQSFNTAHLKTLERHHDPDDVPKSLQLATEAGFKRLNIDLIFAIPGQTLEDWNDTLQQAIGLGLSHYSCYGLTYEPNTPIAVKKRLGQLNPTEESLELAMLRHTRKTLHEHGLDAYEISNYASPGEECRHNLLYWQGGDYLALGPSGASHISGCRWRNRPHLGEWENAVEQNSLPAIEIEHLEPEHRARELAMLRLRLSDGLRFADFNACTGFDARTLFADQIDRLTKLGFLADDGDRIRIPDKGLAVSDAIAAEFLVPAF